jgi:hypothetical protein
MPAYNGNPGGRLPRSFDGLETTVRQHDARIATLERLRYVLNIAIGEGQGANLWSGIGPPTLLIGKNGDFYIDYVNWILYGPRSAIDGWANYIKLGGELPKRRIVSVGGISLDPLQSFYTTSLLYRQERVIEVFVSDYLFDLSMARVRAYITANDRENDKNRDVYDDPGGYDHGVLLEILGERVRLAPPTHTVAHFTAIHGGDWELPASEIQPIYWNIESYNHQSDRLCYVQIRVTRAE